MQVYLGPIPGNEVAGSKDRCVCYFDSSCQLLSTVVEKNCSSSGMVSKYIVSPELLLIEYFVKILHIFQFSYDE